MAFRRFVWLDEVLLYFSFFVFNDDGGSVLAIRANNFLELIKIFAIDFSSVELVVIAYLDDFHVAFLSIAAVASSVPQIHLAFGVFVEFPRFVVASS